MKIWKERKREKNDLNNWLTATTHSSNLEVFIHWDRNVKCRLPVNMAHFKLYQYTVSTYGVRIMEPREAKLSLLGIHQLEAQLSWSVEAPVLRELLVGHLKTASVGSWGLCEKWVGPDSGPWGGKPLSPPLTWRGFGDLLETAKGRKESPNRPVVKVGPGEKCSQY